MFYLFIITGIFIGGFFSIQAAINSSLSKNTPSLFNASLIAFTIGTIILFCLLLIFDFDKLSHIDFSYPFYIYIGGGICGVVYNVSNIFLFKNIGATTTTFLTVTSQIIAGVLFDFTGFLNLPVKGLTYHRLTGILLMILAVYLLSRNNRKYEMQQQRFPKQSRWYLFAFIAGVFSPMQSILNGQLRAAANSPVIASFLSFAVGTVLLLIITLAVQRKIAIPRWDLAGNKLPIWIYCGGIFGVFVVGGNTLIIGTLGSVLTTSLFLAGQLILSMLIDHFGLFQLHKKKVDRQRIWILLLMIASLFIII